MFHKTLVMVLPLLLSVVPLAHAQGVSFTQAVALYRAGQYLQAEKGYRSIVDATDNSDTRLRGLIRLGDCVNLGGPFDDEWADTFYVQILDHGYSPYLAEAYSKWRTTTQMYWHGVSNLSEIPTDQYRARKQQVLEVIAAHLRIFPTDPTALAQQDALRQLPDFQRGGPMGSSVLNDMALLWPEERS